MDLEAFAMKMLQDSGGSNRCNLPAMDLEAFAMTLQDSGCSNEYNLPAMDLEALTMKTPQDSGCSN